MLGKAPGVVGTTLGAALEMGRYTTLPGFTLIDPASGGG
jgi:hypothetical protein